ncbi:hypothetical protein BT69DRAFT_1297523 [Atractiella rhizophila]|nr:hypothetical protein BT69DRAFT_1297523 [Atractiella rhizophila]
MSKNLRKNRRNAVEEAREAARNYNVLEQHPATIQPAPFSSEQIHQIHVDLAIEVRPVYDFCQLLRVDYTPNRFLELPHYLNLINEAIQQYSSLKEQLPHDSIFIPNLLRLNELQDQLALLETGVHRLGPKKCTWVMGENGRKVLDIDQDTVEFYLKEAWDDE